MPDQACIDTIQLQRRAHFGVNILEQILAHNTRVGTHHCARLTIVELETLKNNK